LSLSRDEVLARFEHDEVCHHLDGYVCARCAGGVKWFPRITVEKYSIDQAAFAQRKFDDLTSMGRRPWVERFGLDRLRHASPFAVNMLHGDWLRQLFAEPEDGYAYDSGNSMVLTGLQTIQYLLTSGRLSGTWSANPMQNPLGTSGTGGLVGVGTGTVAWVNTQTALEADNTANAWYQVFDPGYPVTTAGTGTISGQMTATTSNANFAWNEWCWATGSGAVTAGTQLSKVYATAASYAMLNWKVPATSLGSKASGASWVFTQTITFS